MPNSIFSTPQTHKIYSYTHKKKLTDVHDTSLIFQSHFVLHTESNVIYHMPQKVCSCLEIEKWWNKRWESVGMEEEDFVEDVCDAEGI